MDKMQETNILIIIVGILESIAENAITIEEADKYFFSPRTAQLLSKNNCNSRKNSSYRRKVRKS